MGGLKRISADQEAAVEHTTTKRIYKSASCGPLRVRPRARLDWRTAFCWNSWMDCRCRARFGGTAKQNAAIHNNDWHETRWGIARGHSCQTNNRKSAPTLHAAVPRQKTASSAALCAKATRAFQTLFAAAIIPGANRPPDIGRSVRDEPECQQRSWSSAASLFCW